MSTMTRRMATMFRSRRRGELAEPAPALRAGQDASVWRTGVPHAVAPRPVQGSAPRATARTVSNEAGPRILVLSASAGVGHLRAAQAVELAIRERHPRARVLNVDVLQFTNRAFRHVFARTYFDVVRHAPHFLGFMYDRLDKPGSPAMDRARTRLQRVQFGRFTQLLLSQPWDLAINTHFLPADFIASLRTEGRLKLPQVMVTTDFYIHQMWVKQPVERYYMASHESAVNLAHAVPSGSMKVTGIPIHPDFARPWDRASCRNRFGIDRDRPMVLQLAGGFGIGPIEQVHRRLLECQTPLHVVVATGRNTAMRSKVEAIALPSRHRRTVLGFTHEMPELMTAADLIASKPGGLTTSEALATGTPMLIVDPIPGQECRNSDFLLEQGAAIKANTLQGIAYKVDELLAVPDRLTRMARNARAVGRPAAAYEVADDALKLVGVSA